MFQNDGSIEIASSQPLGKDAHSPVVISCRPREEGEMAVFVAVVFVSVDVDDGNALLNRMEVEKIIVTRRVVKIRMAQIQT